MAGSKYKPLSFSTTMRNPERIGPFLKCLIPFENKKLTNSVIDEIVKVVIREKLYKPMYIDRTPRLKSVYYDDDLKFSDEQLNEIIKNSPQKHKEAGFDTGWPSRFDTWYKLAMEFGFVFYEMNEPIIISHSGHMLCDAFGDQGNDDEKIHNIFLNAMARYQSNNPFRKILNANVPLILLLQVIKKLKYEDPNSPGIFRQELSFFICWPDNNAEALYQKIKEFRERYGVSKYTEEIIYNECLRILGYGEADKKYIKIEKMGEARDEYIRKMRITGILSLRGNGRFLDWNTLEKEKIEYVLNNYSSYAQYDTKKAFFEYMGETDSELFNVVEGTLLEIDAIRAEALSKYADEYSKDFVYNELQNVCKKRESKDDLLKFIPAPARLEFLTSVALVQNFKNLIVKPNYPIDDEGIPTSTAAGGMGDIECQDDSTELVEVTLICGRNQVTAEMIPITRHLKDAEEKFGENVFAIFLAPTIHPDAERYSKWTAFNDNLHIKTFGIDDFIDIMKDTDRLSTVIKDEYHYTVAQAAEEISSYDPQ